MHIRITPFCCSSLHGSILGDAVLSRYQLFCFVGSRRIAKLSMQRSGVGQKLTRRKVESSGRQEAKDHSVRDTIGQWHENERQEGWERIIHILPFNLGRFTHHHDSD